VENLLYPEELVLHMGSDKHTVFYPNDTFYDMVLEKLRGREFKGLQRDSITKINWDQVRRNDLGIEVRFSRAIPIELLQRVFKVDADFIVSSDMINRIWIFARQDREEVRTFFFSSDGQNVYESLRADLTVQDVQQYIGFGQYWTPFKYWDGGVYVPDQSKSYDILRVPYTSYTSDQLQRNLFTDPSTTKMIQDQQEGTQIFTDWKRALRLETSLGWMSFTDSVTPTDTQNNLTDNIEESVQFVNNHGGWGNSHQLVRSLGPANDSVIRFQQYYAGLPIVSNGDFRFGYMQLTLQQGVVSSYERSMFVLDSEKEVKGASQKLPAGSDLLEMIRDAADGETVESIFPAYQPKLEEDTMLLQPVWAIRLVGGEVKPVG
jgi:regulatory protein YycH of two-component signal transduction system YycFG